MATPKPRRSVTERSTSSVPQGPRLGPPADPTRFTAAIPMLAVRFRDDVAFLRASDFHSGPAGELRIRTRAAPPPGAEVVLEVRWPDLPNRVYLRACCLRRRFGRVRFRLLASERTKMQFLRTVAEGKHKMPARRVHHRYCVRLPVQWRPFGGRELESGLAVDLSAGGIRLAVATGGLAAPLAIDDSVVVKLAAAGHDLVLTGLLRHKLESDRDLHLGIMFQHRSSGEQRDLRRLIHVFSGRGVLILDAH